MELTSKIEVHVDFEEIEVHVDVDLRREEKKTYLWKTRCGKTKGSVKNC